MSGIALAALLVLVQEPRLEVQELEDGTRIEAHVVTGPEGATIRSGDYLVRDANDAKLVQGEFREGRRHGRWRWRWPDGEKRVLGWYRHGVATKKWEFRRPDGSLHARGAYEHGRRDGRFEVRDATGEPLAEESGTYVWIEREREDGSRYAEGYELDGQRHGRWTYFWPDGRVRLEAEYFRDDPAGRWRFQHVDGTTDHAMYPDEGRPPSVLAALEDELASLPGDPPAASTVPEPGSSLAGTGALPHHPGFPATTAEALRAVEQVLTVDAAGLPAAVERLVAMGHAAVPATLERLWSSAPADAGGAARLHDALREIANGHAPPWGEEPASRRLAALRWYALWAAAFEDEDVLLLDLALPPGEDEDPSALALAPPLDLPVRGKRVYPGRFEDEPPHAEAVEAALGWLVAHQSADGSWSGDGFPTACGIGVGPSCDGVGQEGNEPGLTGAAVLAFLAAGNTTSEGRHAHVVRDGLRWLLRHQHPETGRMAARRHDHHYGHALATLAFCEATCFSASPALRRAAERGVAYILAARNPYGAWRYDFPPEGKNDTSITVWMVRALAAARRAGIDVPDTPFQDALAWIDEVTEQETGRVGYEQLGTLAARTKKNEHFPPEKGEPMTAAGLYCRFLCGQSPDADRILKRHADLLLHQPPSWDPESFGCDMYYWLNGTEAMWQMGGKHWKAWSRRLEPTLVRSQRQGGHAGGSWDPAGPWGYVGGRVYATAFCTLALLTPRREPRLAD